MKELISRLTWVDYLTLILALRGAYVGYRSGIFPELLRVAAYVITVVATFHFYEPLAQFVTLKTFFSLKSATALSFGLLLVGVFLLTKIVMVLFLKLLKVGEGGFVYRFIGLGMGVFRWLVLLSLAFMLIGYVPFFSSLDSDIHKRSVVGPTVSQIAPALFSFLSHISPQLAVDKKAI